MKKKIFDMKKEIESRFGERCKELNIKYLGVYPNPGVTFPKEYRQHFEAF